MVRPSTARTITALNGEFMAISGEPQGGRKCAEVMSMPLEDSGHPVKQAVDQRLFGSEIENVEFLLAPLLIWTYITITGSIHFA